MPSLFKDLKITSLDFQHGGWLDDVHAQDKGNRPPRLSISGVPEGAAELALICHDPDAPRPMGFTHWILYGLPPISVELRGAGEMPMRGGPNGAGSSDYFGPRPPAGHGIHHYYFWVYALDIPVEGTPSREQFLDRYFNHIVEQNRIVGRYEN